MKKQIIMLALILAGCSTSQARVFTDRADESLESETFTYSDDIFETVSTSFTDTDENSSEAVLWTPDEVQAMALTLAGECYDDLEDDKRMVCEVILNRVSDPHFPNTVYDVVSQKNQFSGFWYQSRPVSENDIAISEETLRRWYNNNCEALSDYFFFAEGNGRENVFRKTY